MQKCRVCGQNITPFFSLGKIPLVNTFLKRNQLKKEIRYDLTVAFCKECYLVQLTKDISPSKLFKNYIYFSSTSKSLIEYFGKTAKYLAKKLGLNKKSLVLEIASNDGILLAFFKQMGIGILGIDPAVNVARVANKKGIKTIPEFFNYRFAKKLKAKKVEADLVYGANVLAHVPKIVDFAKGVNTVLKPKGTAIFEFPYLKGLLEGKFDIIYHEHVFYYSLIALKNLFIKANLEIYNVELTKAQGGSLRIYVCHKQAFPIRKSVFKLVEVEQKMGFDKINTYKRMNRNVKKLKRDLIARLKKIKREGKTIAAYSAPAKGNILLNYFGVNNNFLEYIVDKAKEKQGLYTPGTHMLVYPPEKIAEQIPDYLLVLCWNITDEIVKQLSWYKRKGGKFLIPVPQLKVI